MWGPPYNTPRGVLGIRARAYGLDVVTLPTGESLAAAVALRRREVVDRLRDVGDGRLLQASRLPGWDRLTIMCHLR
jgi:hypothetical protein